jgi:GT2 family glycosyltransferase
MVKYESADYPLDISIVIVSWNVADLLDNCIQSIIVNASSFKYEVIIVDNHSADNTVPMLHDKYPWVKLLSNSENVGFAKANNQGFEVARGRYIFVLNPDTIIENNTIPRLVNVLINYPKVGMAGPKLIFPDGKIQETCARLLPTLSSFLIYYTFRAYKLPFVGNWFSKRLNNPYSFDISQTVEAISGAAMLIRHEVMTQVKGFGENYIHTGEDVDLCYKVCKAGCDIYYDCDAIVIHYGGKSSSQNPVRSLVNASLSQQEYFSRWYSKFHGLLYRITVQFIEIPIIMAVGIVKYLFRKENALQFKNRLLSAKEILFWREINQ